MRFGLTQLGWGLAALGVGAIVAASCAVPGFDLVDSTAPTSGGMGGAGAGGTGGPGGAGQCDNAEPPLAPTTEDAGLDVEFVAAVRTLDFGEDFDADVGPTVGYDLDTRCTCLGDEPSCATVGNQPEDCDGPGGRDNAVARLFDNLGLFEGNAFNSQYHSAAANMGAFSLLFRVMGYNGGANDKDVTVAIYTSPGMDADPCNGGQVPLWNGEDRWPVEAFSVAAGGAGSGGSMGSTGGMGGAGGCDASAPGYDIDQPLFVSEFAYVSEHVLVANLPAAGIALGVDDNLLVLRLVGGFVTARIEASPTGFYLRSGIMTGRWTIADFFGVVGTFSAGGDNICKDSALYGPVKEIVCNYADIHAQISGVATPCDALSFGMGFEAEPAQLGSILETSSGMGGGCPPGQDPAGDDCSDQ